MCVSVSLSASTRRWLHAYQAPTHTIRAGNIAVVLQSPLHFEHTNNIFEDMFIRADCVSCCIQQAIVLDIPYGSRYAALTLSAGARLSGFCIRGDQKLK